MANVDQEVHMTKKKLNDLRVVDLRMELEKRGLDKTGIKTALVERLTKTLQEEGLDPDEHLFEVTLEGGSPSVKKLPVKRSGRKLGKENGVHGSVDGQEDIDDDKGESEDEKDELSMEVDNKEEEELNETSAHTEKEQADTATVAEEKSSTGETGKEMEGGDSAATQGSGSKQDSSDITASSTTAETSTKAKSTGVKEIKVISRNEKGEKVRRVLVSSRSLWVSGLASTTRAADLKNLFSKHGKVIGAKIVTNAKTPGARCFGFITMSTSKEASVCIQHLHRTELNGRMISVERTKKDSGIAVKKTDAKTLAARRKVPGAAKTILGRKKIGTVAGAKKDEAQSEKKSEEEAEGKGEEAGKGDKKAKENEKLRMERRRRSRSRSREFRRSFGGRLRGRGFSFRGRGRSFSFRRPYFSGSRGSFFGRPGFNAAKPSLLTFQKIREERMRQREREKEREMREVERRRTQDFFRQKEIEHKHREEAFRLERERERLRIEREKLERERAEVLRLEREKQRLERERLEREKEELRRQQMSRVGRAIKRPYEGRGVRDAETFWEERKRPMMARREKHAGYGEGSANRFQDYNRNRLPYERRDPSEKRERFEGRTKPLDAASRGDYGGAGGHEVRLVDHVERRDGGRVDRAMPRDEMRDSRRESFDRDRFGMADRRVTRESWKPKPREARGFEMSRERPDRYVSGGGKAMMGGRSFANGGRSYDRGGESWESGQGDREMGKSFNSGMMGSQWGSGSKGDSWGRMESSQGDRWGGNVGASVESRHIRGQQGMGPQAGLGHQTQSSMYGSSGPMGGMMSGMSGGFGGDRYNVPIIRRY